MAKLILFTGSSKKHEEEELVSKYPMVRKSC